MKFSLANVVFLHLAPGAIADSSSNHNLTSFLFSDMYGYCTLWILTYVNLPNCCMILSVHERTFLWTEAVESTVVILK